VYFLLVINDCSVSVLPVVTQFSCTCQKLPDVILHANKEHFMVRTVIKLNFSFELQLL